MLKNSEGNVCSEKFNKPPYREHRETVFCTQRNTTVTSFVAGNTVFVIGRARCYDTHHQALCLFVCLFVQQSGKAICQEGVRGKVEKHTV